MSSIFIIKQIVDLVCEELTKNKSIQYQPQSIKRFEELLLKKDEELATLYKENIKLESRIRQVESELDVFSTLHLKSSEDETKVKNEVETQQTQPTETKKEEEESKPKRKRDSEDRKQYMKEYGKKYRQRQREKKIEMNL